MEKPTKIISEENLKKLEKLLKEGRRVQMENRNGEAVIWTVEVKRQN